MLVKIRKAGEETLKKTDTTLSLLYVSNIHE